MISRIIAIGDTHGCSKTFRKLLLEELRINQSDEIYCLGDYVDRGYDSKGVVDLILELRAENFQIPSLRGNHEQVMLESTMDKESHKTWMMMGGNRTLISFRANSYDELQPEY